LHLERREAEVMVMKERDEELSLFLEMRRREKENEKNNLLLLQNSEELDLTNLGMFFSCHVFFVVLVVFYNPLTVPFCAMLFNYRIQSWGLHEF